MTYTFDDAIVSDLFKDAYGFRPGQQWLQTWNTAEDFAKQWVWDKLLRDLDHELARERAEQAAAVESFEKGVTACLENGAADRETAIRWIVEGMRLSDSDLMYGGSYVCFELGLPYDMAGQFDKVCKDLLGGKSFAEVFC